MIIFCTTKDGIPAAFDGDTGILYVKAPDRACVIYTPAAMAGPSPAGIMLKDDWDDIVSQLMAAEEEPAADD